MAAPYITSTKFQGPPGPKGDKGDTVVGPRGHTGPEGPQGARGPAGVSVGPGGAYGEIEHTVLYSRNTPVLVGSVPTGSFLAEIQVSVPVAFDAIGPSLALGTQFALTSLMADAESDLSLGGAIFSKAMHVDGPFDVWVQPTPGSAGSVGQALISLRTIFAG